jgi:hypothetical protein
MNKNIYNDGSKSTRHKLCALFLFTGGNAEGKSKKELIENENLEDVEARVFTGTAANDIFFCGI